MAFSNMATILVNAGLERRYADDSNNGDGLSPVFRAGLIPVAIFAMMSLISVTVLLGFITHRLVSWRRHYREYVGYNQYVILIYNLLLADLQQSIAFSISFHWISVGGITAQTTPCFIQAWFLNIGDVASGFFVLAIAIHTWLGVIKGYKMPYLWFVVSILLIWLLALLLTVIGPAIHQTKFFGRAGGWCWISTKYQDERLWLHYLWIFIVEFGTIAIYAHVFFYLRKQIRGIMNNDTTKLTRATKFMVLYPMVYVLLTLPIAVGRMVAMTGQTMPDEFFIVAGCLLTSCGWIDALLYALTRRVLVNNELSTSQYNQNRTVTAITNNAARPGDDEDYGLVSIQNKESASSAARTVTIIGGSNRLSRLADHRRGRSTTLSRSQDEFEDLSPTRTGSQDSIIKPMTFANGIAIVKETNIEVESTRSEEDDLRTHRTKEWNEANSRHS